MTTKASTIKFREHVCGWRIRSAHQALVEQFIHSSSSGIGNSPPSRPIVAACCASLCCTLFADQCLSLSVPFLGGGLRTNDSKSGSTAHLEQNQTTRLGCKAPAEHWLPGHSQDEVHEVLIRIVAGQHPDKTSPNMTVFGVGH